jgi:hypothetical protein
MWPDFVLSKGESMSGTHPKWSTHRTCDVTQHINRFAESMFLMNDLPVLLEHSSLLQPQQMWFMGDGASSCFCAVSDNSCTRISGNRGVGAETQSTGLHALLTSMFWIFACGNISLYIGTQCQGFMLLQSSNLCCNGGNHIYIGFSKCLYREFLLIWVLYPIKARKSCFNKLYNENL